MSTRRPHRRAAVADRPPDRGVARFPAGAVVGDDRRHLALDQLARVGTGERQHAADRRLEAVERSEALDQHLAMVVTGAIELGLDGDAHRRHRCAQLVGDVRRERPLALEQLADALVGARQRAAERVELVDARVRRRHAVGLAERPGPVAEVLDRAAQAPGEEDPGERRGGDDGDGGEGEHAEVALHPVVALGGRFGDAHDELGAVVADADRQGSHQVALDDAFVDDAGERLGDDRVGGRRAVAVDQHARCGRTARGRGRCRATARRDRSRRPAGTRRATIDASRCSDSSSPRSMWSRTLAAAGTKSASTASVATATIVARMRFLMPRCRSRAACRRGGSRCRGSWRCGWRHPTARRACGGCC